MEGAQEADEGVYFDDLPALDVFEDGERHPTFFGEVTLGDVLPQSRRAYFFADFLQN